jgi:PhnB protein
MKRIIPYLSFDGDCREAMTFYQQRLGGELHLMSFAEAGFDAPPEGKDRQLHARLVRGDLVLMASDTMPGTPFQRGDGVELNLECESDREVDELYAALVEGGQATMAPHDAFWGAS